jgi:peptidoglycan-associated lipoprotein
MLKRLSLVTVVLSSAVFLASCKSKPKSEAPVGGAEGGQLDTSVKQEPISNDLKGSDGGAISGLVSVHFDYDSSTINSATRKDLASNGDWIKKNGNTTVQIEGHCDSRGSVEYNLALGERRAKAVKNYLTSLGIESKRLTIISFGEEKPIAQGDTEDAYAKNRRANFVPLAQ